MKKLKIYLDTSVVNFLHTEDAPELRRITEDFFENYVREGRYDVYISDVLIREIERTSNPMKKTLLLSTLEQYKWFIRFYRTS